MVTISYQDRCVSRIEPDGRKVRLSLQELIDFVDKFRKSNHLIARFTTIDTERRAVNLLLRSLQECGYTYPSGHFFIFRLDGTKLLEVESSFTLDEIDSSVWERLPRQLHNGKIVFCQATPKGNYSAFVPR